MQKTKRLFALLLCITMLCSLNLSVFATEPADSIGSVKEDISNETMVGQDSAQEKESVYDEFNNARDEEVEVYVTKASTYTVTIPKVVVLSGATKVAKGEYTVRVQGDISGTEYISVVPEASFALKHAGKANLTAYVEQDKTAWTYANLATDGYGVITADGLSAGSWKGSFYFNISRDVAENIPGTSIPVSATDKDGNDLNASSETIEGLAKDVLLNKLEESGIVASGTQVDALIEVNSDTFDDLAETTFDVSSIAQPGDKVVILHYDETKQEWEYVGEGIVQEDGTVTAIFSSYSPVGFVVIKDDGSTEDTWPVYFGKYYELVGDNREYTNNGGNNTTEIVYANGFVFYPDGSWIAYWEDSKPTSSGAGYITYKGDDLCIGDNGEYVYATLSQDKRTLTLMTGKQLKLCADPEVYYNEHYFFTPYGELAELDAFSVVLRENGTIDMYDVNGTYVESQPYQKISNKIMIEGSNLPAVVISDSGTVLFTETMAYVCPVKTVNIPLGTTYGYSFKSDNETYVVSIVIDSADTFTVYTNGEAGETGTYMIRGDLVLTSIGVSFVISEDGSTLSFLSPDGNHLILNKFN